MKPRILTFGIAAAHDAFTPLTSISDDLSISDLDAFVIDPNHIQSAPNGEIYLRRRIKIGELLRKKGGIVICLLRPNNLQTADQGVGPFGRYSLLLD